MHSNHDYIFRSSLMTGQVYRRRRVCGVAVVLFRMAVLAAVPVAVGVVW